MNEMPREPGTAVIEADPKRPYKAYVGAVLTGVGVFVAAWIADTDPFTSKEAGAAALAAVGAAAGGFGIVFGVKNPLRSRLLR